MKLRVVLTLVSLLAGCQSIDVGNPKLGPAFLTAPEPSMIVVTVPSAGPGEPEAQDATYRITGLGRAVPVSVRLQDYEISYFDIDDRPVPDLNLDRRPLPAPLLVGTGQSAEVDVDVYRPEVGQHGVALLSTAQERVSAVMTARVNLFGRDQNDGEMQLVMSVPIRFERKSN